MSKLIKEGWVAITPTVCQGDVMAWSTEGEGEEPIPWVFDTVEDVWKEIAETMIIELQQFIDGEREFEHTSFSTDEYAALYQEFEDGTFVVSDEEGNPIIETTIEKWRASR